MNAKTLRERFESIESMFDECKTETVRRVDRVRLLEDIFGRMRTPDPEGVRRLERLRAILTEQHGKIALYERAFTGMSGKIDMIEETYGNDAPPGTGILGRLYRTIRLRMLFASLDSNFRHIEGALTDMNRETAGIMSLMERYVRDESGLDKK